MLKDIYVCLILSCSLRVQAQIYLDQQFGNNGVVILDSLGFEGAWNSALQSDGSIIVTGWRHKSFCGKNGIVVIDSSPDDRAFAIDLQKDGKILVAGLSSIHDWDFAVLRLNPDGSPDLSFGVNGKVITDINGGIDVAFSIKALDDGRIITCVWSLGLNDFDFTVVRYNHDGSLDLTFGNNGIVTSDLFNRYNSAHSIDVQDDGKYVVAGYTYRADRSDYDIVVLRYNTDGTLVQSFGEQGIVITDINNGNEFAWKVALQKIRRLLLADFI